MKALILIWSHRTLRRICVRRTREELADDDEASNDARLSLGQTLRQRMHNELGDSPDRPRVHFLGKAPYSAFLKILQASPVRIYPTYPFVLS